MIPHEHYMQEALNLAQNAAELGESPIGCVIVKGDRIVGRGMNRREIDRDALAHAEILAIADACRTLGGWRLFGCDLYVTLEPCPMCAGAIINARIDRVIFGAYDAKAGSCGSIINLFDLPYNHKPEVIGGIMEDQCSYLLRNFFKLLRDRRRNLKID